MKKVISMGPYIWNEDAETWISFESVVEGTIRSIEDVLFVATPGKLYLDEEEYDPCTQNRVSEKDVIYWYPYEFIEDTNSSE